MCFVENLEKQQLLSYTTLKHLNDWSYITEVDSVYRAVRTESLYRVGHKSLTILCKSQSMRNRWITTICDLIRPRGKSLGGVTLTAAIL